MAHHPRTALNWLMPSNLNIQILHGNLICFDNYRPCFQISCIQWYLSTTASFYPIYKWDIVGVKDTIPRGLRPWVVTTFSRACYGWDQRALKTLVRENIPKTQSHIFINTLAAFRKLSYFFFGWVHVLRSLNHLPKNCNAKIKLGLYTNYNRAPMSSG